MAAGLNRVSLIGNLGRDPELRQTQSGMAVATIRIGVTERRKDGDEYKDHTEWVSVVCFGKTAENVNKYLQKGRQVFVEGRLQTRTWEDKTGQTRYTTEVVANQILFLGSARDHNSSSSSFAQAPAPSQTPIPSQAATIGNNGNNGGDFVEDDNIPF